MSKKYSNKKLFVIYETKNNITGKIYVGFHGLSHESDLLYEFVDIGSVFKDGYLGSGAIMKAALAKYGPHNMSQRVLFVTKDQTEAESFEKNIVNEDFVKDDNNYNIVTGGNVCIMFGENNGFYGKTHSKETIEKIQNSRNKTLKEKGFSWSVVTNNETGKNYLTREAAMESIGLSIDDFKSKKDFLYAFDSKIVSGNFEYKRNEKLQEKSLKRYEKRRIWLEGAEERNISFRKKVSERFKGKQQSEEQKRKRGESISSWIKNNPEEHANRMHKINSNPEKHTKMAETHRGMKRSEAAKENMKTAQRLIQKRKNTNENID